MAVLPESHFSMMPCCGPVAGLTTRATVGRIQAATVNDPVILRDAESGTSTTSLLADTARLAGVPAGTAALLVASMAAPPRSVPSLAGDVPERSGVIPELALFIGQ